MAETNPLAYFDKFPDEVQGSARGLVKLILTRNPELEITTKYHSPFFRLKSNQWSVFSLIYQQGKFKIGFVNDAAMEFHESKRHLQLSGTEHQQNFLFDPNIENDRLLALDFIREAIVIQSRRSTEEEL